LTEVQSPLGEMLGGGLIGKLTAKLLIEKVVFDPETGACRIHYQIGIENRNKLASPTGFEPVSPP